MAKRNSTAAAGVGATGVRTLCCKGTFTAELGGMFHGDEEVSLERGLGEAVCLGDARRVRGDEEGRALTKEHGLWTWRRGGTDS